MIGLTTDVIFTVIARRAGYTDVVLLLPIATTITTISTFIKNTIKSIENIINKRLISTKSMEKENIKDYL